MCLLALSCSKNHLFVCLAGGGRSSVYGTDPTSILRVAPSRGGVLALIQVDEWSEFHRRPGSSHSLVAPFQFTPRRRMWQRCQQHERGPIKEHTRVAVDDNASFADSGHSAHVVDFVTQPRQSSSPVKT